MHAARRDAVEERTAVAAAGQACAVSEQQAPLSTDAMKCFRDMRDTSLNLPANPAHNIAPNMMPMSITEVMSASTLPSSSFCISGAPR